MKKIITIIGVVMALIWGFITWMTKGIPQNILDFIDMVTFHLFTDEVFRMGNGFYYDANNNSMPTVAFIFLFSVIFILYAWLIFQVEARNEDKGTLTVVILFSILFRVIIFTGEMIHENDIYRYLWDGKSAKYEVNPYKYAPADVFMYENNHEEDYYDTYREVTIKAREFSRREKYDLEVLKQLRDKNLSYYYRIGHWQVPTIYPPFAEGVFLLVSRIKEDSIALMKLVFMLFDIGVLLVITRLLHYFRMKRSLCLIYGFSPLVLKEFANSGHYDPIVIFFTMTAIWMFFQRKKLGGAVSLTIAVLTKFFALILFPFFLKKKDGLMWVVAFLLMCTFYVPYFTWGHTSVLEIFKGFMVYNENWSYNSSIFAFIYAVMYKISPSLVSSLFWVKLVCGLIYLEVLFHLYCDDKRTDVALFKKCFFAVAALFIINPVGDPWYFCWVIPFLCVFRYRSWLLLSGLLILSYLNFHSDYPFLDLKFFQIHILNYIIYVPFFISLIIEYNVLKRKKNPVRKRV